MKKNLACAEVSSSDSTHLQKIWKSYSRKILVLTFMGLCAAISSAQVYNVTDLSTLGGFFSQAMGINDIGQVVGYSDIADHSAIHAFVWTRAHGMLDIHPAGMSQSMGVAINDLGQVAGVAISTGDRPTIHAFVWSHKGVVDLGTLGGASSQAFGINNFGQTVGQADTSSSTSNAFLSKNRAQMRDLGTLGGDSSIALALNDFGQIVGGSLTGEAFHAFLWTKSRGMQDLGVLGGCESIAASVNNYGQVVGGSSTTCDGSIRHAFLWTKRDGMRDLGTPLGTSFGGPGAINLFGQIVGAACPENCVSQESVHAFIWTSRTEWLDLNDLIPSGSGWVLENTQAINAWGQIAGRGLIGGEYHAFLLSPNTSRDGAESFQFNPRPKKSPRLP
jgi:probable HAF family extracellular repeat protein